MATMMKDRTQVLFLIVSCTLIELVLQASDWGLLPSQRLRLIAYYNGGFWPGLLGRGWDPNYVAQPYTMFMTYGFLHSGLLHLGVNMLTLWSLGGSVLDRVGRPGFLLLYLLSLIGGAIGFWILADYSPQQSMVGASGAIFGLAGGLLAWTYVDRYTYQKGLLPIAQAVLLLILLNLILWWAMEGQLAWETHLGGFFTGWIAAMLIDPRPRHEQ